MRFRSGLGFVLTLIAVVLVAGCRESEQDRPLRYDKGQSPFAGQGLEQPAREVLRQRHRYQYDPD